MDDRSRIIAAVQSGKADELRALLAKDPSLAAAANEQGVSAIMLALYHHQAEALKLLAAVHPDLNLFESAATGDVSRLRLLLDESPASISSYSADGFTALHFACFFAREAAAVLLLERGADVAAVAQNSMRVMPLHSAAAARNVAVVRALLDHGAPANARQQGGWTSLHAAAQHGDREIAELLLKHGADRKLMNDEGITASALAEKNGHKALAELLA
ncbi:MAG TPA: ankyrin repeat domain-containing protein [Terriglobales bacterium]|jgi:ankyrin repeat protein